MKEFKTFEELYNMLVKLYPEAEETLSPLDTAKDIINYLTDADLHLNTGKELFELCCKNMIAEKIFNNLRYMGDCWEDMEIEISAMQEDEFSISQFTYANIDYFLSEESPDDEREDIIKNCCRLSHVAFTESDVPYAICRKLLGKELVA